MKPPENFSAQLDAIWQRAFTPRAELGICEWGARNVKPPNSARTGTGSLDLDVTPWLRTPAEASGDPETRGLVLLAPTGGSKTTLIDLRMAHEVAEGGGAVLVSMQSDPEADSYWDERAEPILEAIEKVCLQMAALPKGKRRKGEILFPGRTLYVQGNHKNVFQRKSVRLVCLDEAWLLKHGYMEEAIARTHNRWNRLVMVTSQGGLVKIASGSGERVDSELEQAWRRSTMEEYSAVCPECGHKTKWHRNHLDFVTQYHQDGSFDERALIESVRYVCAGVCKSRFEDKPATRWELTNGSVYLPTNPHYVPHPHGHHRGFHVPAVALPHEPWSDLALGWTRSAKSLKRGDPEPRKIYIQKRDAENYLEEEDEEPAVALTFGKILEAGAEVFYTLAHYNDGQLWDGENIRIATIDRQRDHFWLVVRAWKLDGYSRRLYAGKINTMEALRLKLETMKVKPENTFEDSGYKADDEVYNDCGRYGWYALKGDAEATSYFFEKQKKRKFYSPITRVTGTSAKPASLIRWAVLPIKRILDKMRDGYREPWEVEHDISPIMVRHLFSEVEKDIVSKQTKRITRTFVARHKDNHTRDCEGMQVVGALIRGMLADAPATKPDLEQKPEQTVNRGD